MDKIFGGPIIPTLFRILLLSFFVGLVLWVFGLDPVDIWREFGATIQRAWTLVFDALDWAWKYAALGAIIVVPVWIAYRVILYLTKPKA
jgi:hypothetical protein